MKIDRDDVFLFFIVSGVGALYLLLLYFFA